MKILFGTLCLLMTCNAFAQDYVFTNRGDTLVGEIKEPLFEYLFYQRAVFKDDERTVYQPEDLKGYKFGNDTYETHNVGKKRPEIVFLKPLVRGYCTLYEYQYVDPIYGTTGAYSSQPIVKYYLKKPGEEFHLYNFGVLKNGRDLYFLDNAALTFDLRQGKYKKKDVRDIVERYNREQQPRQ